MTTIGDKIKSARELKGLTQSDLASKVGVSRNAVSLWESNKNGPSLATLLKVCAELDLSPDGFSTVQKPIQITEELGAMAIKGEVRAGAWLEFNDDMHDFGTLPTLPDPRYSNVEQFALKVVGTSMNKVTPPGQYVIVAAWDSIGAELKDGDLVVVRRERAMTYEATLKRAKKIGNSWELWPESTDPRYQEPVKLADGDSEVEVRIIGKVIGRYEPL